MKIAIISDFFYPELSGVSDAILLLGSSLIERGHEVIFIVPKYPQTIENPKYKVVRLPSVRFPNSPTGQGMVPLPTGICIKTLTEFKPDIIHTNSPYVPGLEALIYARFSKTPIVGTHHTITSEFMKGSPEWIVRATLRYNSWFYSRCSFVSAPSQSLIDEMVAYGLKTTSRSISNPIDISHFSAAHGEVNEPVILYAGRLSGDKHVDVIIRALPEVLKKIPNARLVIAGRGSSEQDLHKLTKELSLDKYVDFRGVVKMEEMPKVYKESAVFVIMSTSESQSLVLMQAMASGKPVVGARSYALAEYITPDVGITVEPGDHVALSRELISILEDKERAKRMGKAGIEKVKGYSPQIVAEMWENIYKEEIKTSHGKPKE